MKKIKLTETNGSYKCVLPKHMVDELGWRKGDKLAVKKVGKKMMLAKEVQDVQENNES